MLSERENNVLKIIVEEYIKTARPVASSYVCDQLNCSSATIRNDMVHLEEKGYLEKTHISSGRIPSDKGYNYYIDNLLNLKDISGEDMLKLQLIFSNKNLELSDAISRSLEIISDITNYTTVKLGDKGIDSRLKEIKALNINHNEMVVIVITDKGYVEHRNIYLDSIDVIEVEKTINLINSMISGTYMTEVNQKLEYEVKPIIARYVKEHEKLYATFYNVLANIQLKNVDIQGEKNILKIPEFAEQSDKTYNILSKLEEKNLFSDLETADNEIKFYIGGANQLDDDLTIAKTTYKTNKESGTIAVIGPKRMDYKRVLNMLKYIKTQIEGGQT